MWLERSRFHFTRYGQENKLFIALNSLGFWGYQSSISVRSYYKNNTHWGWGFHSCHSYCLKWECVKNPTQNPETSLFIKDEGKLSLISILAISTFVLKQPIDCISYYLYWFFTTSSFFCQCCLGGISDFVTIKTVLKVKGKLKGFRSTLFGTD